MGPALFICLPQEKHKAQGPNVLGFGARPESVQSFAMDKIEFKHSGYSGERPPSGCDLQATKFVRWLDYPD